MTYVGFLNISLVGHVVDPKVPKVSKIHHIMEQRLFGILGHKLTQECKKLSWGVFFENFVCCPNYGPFGGFLHGGLADKVYIYGIKG